MRAGWKQPRVCAHVHQHTRDHWGIGDGGGGHKLHREGRYPGWRPACAAGGVQGGDGRTRAGTRSSSRSWAGGLTFGTSCILDLERNERTKPKLRGWAPGAGLLGLPPAEATPVPPASPLGMHQSRATRIASNALLLTSPVPHDYGNPAARVERYSGNRTVASCILTSRSRVRGPQAVGILTVTGGG